MTALRHRHLNPRMRYLGVIGPMRAPDGRDFLGDYWHCHGCGNRQPFPAEACYQCSHEFLALRGELDAPHGRLRDDLEYAGRAPRRDDPFIAKIWQSPDVPARESNILQRIRELDQPWEGEIGG